MEKQIHEGTKNEEGRTKNDACIRKTDTLLFSWEVPVAEAVINAVCAEWGMTREELMSPRKVRGVTEARFAGMFLLLERRFSEGAAAGAFGKDHGVASYAKRRVPELIDIDVNYRKRIEAARKKLAGNSAN